ncbi:receptor-like serine/threonine-protein kinase SD1-8 isoform X1 [Canna indica]|uniref:Receptor-like serine/threonine-protein kinase n=1 Tax=Canna indica TaxID=4628 RepID=A0AAQ3QFU4_9LILI|nr:receptor-like serine/threonine-protein kinase SD1-8 isoform X1 [Canna indica]
MTNFVSSIVFVLAATSFFSLSTGELRDKLTPTQPLADDGGALISAAGNFELTFFSPADSSNRYIGIRYHANSDHVVVWVANRQRPVISRSGRLSVTTNGTLIVTEDNSTVVVWSSSSPALKIPVARLLDNGNFVVMEAGSSDERSSYAWQSFDFPTDTLLPGMMLGWDLDTGVSRNLTAWRSASNPAPGDYVAGLDRQGDPQLFLWNGTRPYWRGGPWNGLRFSGVPDMAAMEPGNDLGVYYEFLIDPSQVFYWFGMRNPLIISRLVMNHSGLLQRFLWIHEKSNWVLLGHRPKVEDPCDKVLSPCGQNAFCKCDAGHAEPEASPVVDICECLQGFHPKDTKDWTRGCARETTMLKECGNRADGFFNLSNAKLPDTSRSTVNWTVSLEQCKDLCLNNCSCTAYASSNISGVVSGCINWTTDLTDLMVYTGEPGQDLYVRQLAVDSGHSHRGNLVTVIVASVLAICIVAIAVTACWIWRMKKRRRHFDDKAESKDLDLPVFHLSTIIDATVNFSIDNKLGEGGFGPVYKGKLGNDQEIAVKRLSKSSSQGVDEFKNEVILIAKLQHRNLVRLLGCCVQGGERILVYEYMPNGSLDAFLFNEAKSTMLDWQRRYNIIVGIARALLYLHHDSRFKIIHRDLKASNVLLDKDMNPKISDFGMARIFRGDDSEVNTRRIVGTYGYMSPEYAMDGTFSIKSDVFSFGVLVLEIISGKRNRGVYQSALHLNLLGHIWNLWQADNASELIDKSIGPSVSTAELMSCIKIGLLCVQERPGDRPTMH